METDQHVSFEHQTDVMGRQPKPSGLGGWLILIQIGLYLSLLAHINQFYKDLIPLFTSEEWKQFTADGSEYYHPLWKPILIYGAIVTVLFILFITFALINLYSKRRAFKYIMIIYYSANLLLLIVDLVILLQIPYFQQLNDDSILRDIIQQVIICAIWIPYFLKSKRVKNTFIR